MKRERSDSASRASRTLSSTARLVGADVGDRAVAAGAEHRTDLEFRAAPTGQQTKQTSHVVRRLLRARAALVDRTPLERRLDRSGDRGRTP